MSYPNKNRSFYPEGGDRRHDSRPTPKGRQHQAPRRKTPPPAPRPCIVLFDNTPTTYVKEDSGRKFLSMIMNEEPTVFPSRKKAKAAIYWTVYEMYPDLQEVEGVGATWVRFKLQYVGG
jgi:hypothetical protein